MSLQFGAGRMFRGHAVEPDDPPDSGLTHHYDATDSDSVVTSGGTVDEWHDLVGSADLTGSATSLDSSAINGNQAILFDGADDTLRVSSFSALPQPNTIYIVFVPNDQGSTRGDLQHGDTNADRNMATTNLNGGYAIWAGNWLEGSAYTQEPHYLGGIYDGSNSELRIDGQQDATGDAGPQNLGDICIGSKDGSSDHFDGYIGEICIYDTAVSTTQRDEIESYIADKWGITL